MNNFVLPFDLRLCNKMDQHALLCCQKYNFGNESDWFGTFRGGLYGFYSRINGVKRHFYQVHAWIPTLCTPSDTEYHMSAILFNMDSAIECFTFALNALGNSVCIKGFRDITDSKSLQKIHPRDVLGDPDRKKPLEPMSGFAKYFPRTQKLWINRRDLLDIIFENHDVSKHRETVFRGGKCRNDPPAGFFEALGITDKANSILYTPMAEIILISDPKTPRRDRQPTPIEDQILLEEIAFRFCYFINKTVVLATQDALANIKPPVKKLNEQSANNNPKKPSSL